MNDLHLAIFDCRKFSIGVYMAEQKPTADDPQPDLTPDISYRLSLQTLDELIRAVADLMAYVAVLEIKQQQEHYEAVSPAVAKLKAIVENLLPLSGTAAVFNHFERIEEIEKQDIRERGITPLHVQAIEEWADELKAKSIAEWNEILRTLSAKKPD
jgi:uncharacterized membrane protein YfbV (UPF0208 family)